MSERAGQDGGSPMSLPPETIDGTIDVSAQHNRQATCPRCNRRAIKLKIIESIKVTLNVLIGGRHRRIKVNWCVVYGNDATGHNRP
ncbi:hypothetical protein RDWZM_008158 [Blomia tropicalis]|uniref:Uncharacterized protein n=1 Tax=Blomia tropicalis TaxID=40697 RepID=A0A9Q0RL54_BLOTA|nr:hypothetical protein RDWZM_008158 [Blomia tropicalis]